MPYVSDFTKHPNEVVVDLINDANTTTLPYNVLTFGLPTQSANGSTLNTDISVGFVEGSGYSGNVVVQYDRLNIQGFVTPEDFPTGLSILVEEATMISHLIPKINTALGINLTSADYIEGALPQWAGLPNEVLTTTVNAASGSLVFIGGLTFELLSNDIPLETVITTLYLGGLNYPV